MWKNRPKFDCVVVGGGPAGCTFARVAAEGGLSVLVLEKDREIGVPVRCGEAVSDEGLRLFVDPRERWIKATITRIKLVAPDETTIEFNLAKKGYILDRRIFDHDLARYAAQAGATIVTKAYVDGLLREGDQITGVTGQHLGERFRVAAKLVIGADGVESRVGRWAGLPTHTKLKDMESAIQKTVAGITVQENMFEFYLSRNWAPGGYLWVFPKGKHEANIGLGISGLYAKDGQAAHRYLDEFIKWKYPQASVLTTVAGGVPVARSLKRMVADSVMLVGDAARTVNPMTGGGIISGMRSGQLAAETAVAVLKQNRPTTRENLTSYEKNWHQIGGKNHERYYRLKEAIFKYSDEDLNNIAAALVTIPEAERSLYKLFSKAVMKKPSLLLVVGRLFTGL
ncbi:MAG: NAD(P)/FAD-dependent oxidoreductase [Fidelibacterota bacterium]